MRKSTPGWNDDGVTAYQLLLLFTTHPMPFHYHYIIGVSYR
jgi:hypothetical protein